MSDVIDTNDELEEQKRAAAKKLMEELKLGETSGNEQGWFTHEDLLEHLENRKKK